MIPQEAEPYLLVCARESQVEACVDRVLLWDQGTAYNSPGISPFEGGCHYYHYPYHSLASGKTTGREHSPQPHQKKIGLKTYRA